MSENDFTPIPDGFKKCKDCGDVKPLTEYSVNRTNKDGRLNRCKICTSLLYGHQPKQRKPEPRQIPELGIIEIPLSKGQNTVIDMIDADLARFEWTIFGRTEKAYIRRKVTVDSNTRVAVTLHRIILERIIGRTLEDGEVVDHIDGNTFNNRRNNLRLATSSQNSWNQKRHKDSKSGYKGVHFFKRDQNWRAIIRVKGKTIFVGSFETPEEAYAAWCKAARLYHGEFARLE